MFTCRKCKSKRIKIRKNYPFGKRSKPRIKPVHCRRCGSTEVKKE